MHLFIAICWTKRMVLLPRGWLLLVSFKFCIPCNNCLRVLVKCWMLQVWFHISYQKYISACEPSPYELFVDFFPNVYSAYILYAIGRWQLFWNIPKHCDLASYHWLDISFFFWDFLEVCVCPTTHIDIIHLAVLSYLFLEGIVLLVLLVSVPEVISQIPDFECLIWGRHYSRIS